MTFKPAKCPNCAGDLQVPDDRDSVKCMYCGSDIIVREAIKLAGGVNIENLLTLAKHSEELNDFRKALEYYEQILAVDVKNVSAWVGKGISGALLNPKSGSNKLKACLEKAISYSNDKDSIKMKLINMLFDQINKYPGEKNIFAENILDLDKDNFEAQFIIMDTKGICNSIGQLKEALVFTKNSPSHRQYILDLIENKNEDIARIISANAPQNSQDNINTNNMINEVFDMLPNEYSNAIKKAFVKITSGLNTYGPALTIRNKFIKQIQIIERKYRPVKSRFDELRIIERKKQFALTISIITGIATCLILYLKRIPIENYIWGSRYISFGDKFGSWLNGINPLLALILFIPALVGTILQWIISSYIFPLIGGVIIWKIFYKILRPNSLQ